MGLVEQAAQRLEELRRAGVAIETFRAPPSPSRPGAEPASTAAGAPPRAKTPGAPHASNARATPLAPGKQPAAEPRVTVDLAELAAQGLITPEVQRSQIG